MASDRDARHEILALRAKNGDQEAEECLIREYKNVVRGKAHSYFIIGADEEDVVQEGMIGLFRAIRTYDAGREASFRTYAELCISRQIISAIRSAARKKHQPLNTSVSLNKPVESESGQTLEETIPGGENADPETLMVVKDVMGYVTRNEGRLFSDFELTVWSEYIDGRSYAEISEKLGKNQKAIYNAMDRIKKKITEFLSDS